MQHSLYPFDVLDSHAHVYAFASLRPSPGFVPAWPNEIPEYGRDEAASPA